MQITVLELPTGQLETAMKQLHLPGSVARTLCTTSHGCGSPKRLSVRGERETAVVKEYWKKRHIQVLRLTHDCHSFFEWATTGQANRVSFYLGTAQPAQDWKIPRKDREIIASLRLSWLVKRHQRVSILSGRKTIAS